MEVAPHQRSGQAEASEPYPRGRAAGPNTPASGIWSTRSVRLARWDSPFPQFAYSESRERLRQNCARAYYYSVYASHGGWAAAPGTERWLAYRLKCATPLAAALGTVVHDAAKLCVIRLRDRHALPATGALYDRCAHTLNAIWRSSREGRQAFWKHPRSVPMFEEALYGVGPSRLALQYAGAKLERVLAALVGLTTLWEMVARAPRGAVRVVDRYFQFELSLAPRAPISSARASEAAADDVRVQCYAAPDLLVRPASSSPTYITDFKSGRPDGVVDQVMTYALAAEEGLRLDPDGGWIGAVAALDCDQRERVKTEDKAAAGNFRHSGAERDASPMPSAPSDALTWRTFPITPQDLTDARARIAASVAAMARLIDDPVENRPKAIDAFPRTSNPTRCNACTFRVLCFPQDFPVWQPDGPGTTGPGSNVTKAGRI